MCLSHQLSDQLWKDVITDLFEEFLLFFSPNLYEQVDFTSPPIFLEQELQTILPESAGNKRVADKLVKLQLKNGKEQWVFVHIEVQGGYKKNFPKRMFQSFYRIMDMYDQHVYALALFTDEDSKYNLNQLHYEFLGTELTYSYNTYRIASQSESSLLQSHNPFALAVLAGLYAIKSKKNVDLTFKYKHNLMRILLQDKIRDKEIKREYIQKLLIFIDHILRLPEEADITLVQELKPLIDKEEAIMGLSLEDTSFAKYFRNEGKEEGKAEGRAEGKEIGKAEGEKLKAIEIARNLLELNFNVETTSRATGLTEEEVKKLRIDS
jgi:predicted transposase/invertase (TIGR01784 family)